MIQITVPKGQRVVQVVPIIDPSTGRLDVRWTSSDTLIARVWAGQERAHVALTAAWSGDPADGAQASLTITDTVSADLDDGRWPFDLQVSVSGTATAVGGGYLVVVPGTATSNDDTAPRSYITGREFRDTVGPFADTLQTKYGQTSNLQALNLATVDLDDAIARRFAIAYRDRGGDESSQYDTMIALLAADGLEVTAPVKRYVAYKALWYLAEWTPGGDNELERIRVKAHEHAAVALRSIVAYVNDQYVIPMGGAVRLVR